VFIPGPEQADTIIDTDSQVNQQIALWIRHASEVIRGHTIVVPVKGISCTSSRSGFPRFRTICRK
jgi:uncharacterized membrane protein (UPF0182 family)